jgi:hypothetical protein
VLVGLAVATCLLAANGCSRIERGKQVRAQGALQYLIAVIENHYETAGSIPSLGELQGLVDSERLRDPWGEKIRYEVFSDSDRPRYVLASLGSDKTLDVGDIRDYLVAAPEDIAYEVDRDIVVVDGIFVRNAGK